MRRNDGVRWKAGPVFILAVAAAGCSRGPAPAAPETPAATEARYTADPAVCAACHPAQSATYRETGMARSFVRATPAAMNRKIEQQGGAFYHAASDRHYTLTRRGDRFYLRRHQKGSRGEEINVFEAAIDYVLGSGNHSRTYLHRTPDNRLMELPVSWYAENGGVLAMSPGYDTAAHWDFRRPVSSTCFACHNAYPREPMGGGGLTYPENVPEGIDCQRCHGPGQAHVDAARQAKPVAAAVRAAIVNPKRLSAEREFEVCLQCHLETTSFELPNAMIRHGRGVFSYRPGEALADYQLHFDHAKGAGHDDKFEIAGAAYRLRQSVCFQRSGVEAMRCTTCHDPHTAPRGEKAVAHYRAACLRCHEAKLNARIQAGAHTRAADCASCHMLKRRTEDVVHVAMTDHRIARRPAAASERERMAARAERHFRAGQRGYQGEVVAYYPASVEPAAGPDGELYLAVAQVAQGSNLAAGIPRLEAALAKRGDGARAGFFVDLGLAYLTAGGGADDKAVAAFQAALRKDGRSAAALRGLGAALLRKGEAARAAETLERARALDARDAPTLHELARAYRQMGRAPEAVAQLEAAVAADPDLTEAWDALGNLLAEAGDLARAEEKLREAIRRQPDFAAAHGNLANVLMARQVYEEAEAEYKRAIALDPKLAAARYNYGGALAAAGRFAEAEAQLAAATAASPGLAEAYAVWGDLLARQRNWNGAKAKYAAALSASPGLGRAQIGLALSLAAAGDPAAARRQLQQTAASHADPAVRQMAAEALREMDAGTASGERLPQRRD